MIHNPNIGDTIKFTAFDGEGNEIEKEGRVTRKGPMKNPTWNNWHVKVGKETFKIAWHAGAKVFTICD